MFNTANVTNTIIEPITFTPAEIAFIPETEFKITS